MLDELFAGSLRTRFLMFVSTNLRTSCCTRRSNGQGQYLVTLHWDMPHFYLPLSTQEEILLLQVNTEIPPGP